MSALRDLVAPRWDIDLAYSEEFMDSPFNGTRISHGDLDFEVEVNGYFLVIEGKRAWEQMSTGQRIAMDARVRDGRTVLLLFGDPPLDLQMMQHYPRPPVDATWAEVWQFEHEWFEWARCQPRPEPRRSSFKGEKA